MSNTLLIMLDYKDYADDLSYATMADLPEEELVKQGQTTFGSILSTLNHVQVVDDIFRYHLEGRQHP